MNEKKRKKKLYKSFVCFVLLAFVCANIFFTLPFKKVNADKITPQQEIPIYYFDTYLTYPNTQTIVIYLLDAYILDIDTCQYRWYYMQNEGTLNSTGLLNAQFLPFSQLDYEDYKAYIFNFSLAEPRNQLFGYLDFNGVQLYYTEIGAPSGTPLTRFYIKGLYYAYNQYLQGEEFGQNEGYQLGFREAETYYNAPNEGYNIIFGQGYAKGYNEGETAQIDANFMQSIFTSLDAFFKIHFAPNLTIGELFLAPLIIWFVWFIIKQFKGGD